MKKYQLFSFAIALFALLQSCAITTENTYHKDATSSMLMTVDMKEAMGFIKSMGDSDSSKAPVNFSKYAKDWESLYDREKKQALEKGEKFSPAGDTAKVMKKIFSKMDLDENGEMQGISVKYDRLTKTELLMLADINSKGDDPMTATNLGLWDGKTMVLDLSKLDSDELMNKGKIPNGEEDEEQNKEAMKNMVKMFKMTYTNTIKFDNKIKSIKGKHDWVTQKDDHTILLTVDLGQLADDDLKLKNKDSKIIITTE